MTSNPTSEATTAIASERRMQQLRACEDIITQHFEQFVEVGNALKKIRDEKLYQAAPGCHTFERYCRKKWDFGVSRASQLISAAALRPELPDLAEFTRGKQVWTERLVRELDRLPSSSQVKHVVEKVKKSKTVREQGLTSPKLRGFVDRELGPKPKPKPKPKPPMFDEVVFRWTGRLDGIADLLESVSDEDIQLFGKQHPEKVEAFAQALERIEQSLARVRQT